MKRSILLCLLIFLPSCTTINIQTVGGRLISPEAQGDTFKGTLSGTSSYASTYALDFTSLQVNAPLSHKTSGRANGVGTELGIWGPIDIIAAYNAETELGLKWQFVGDTRQAAKGGSFSASLVGMTASASRNSSDASSSDDRPLRVRGFKYKKESKSYGLMAGYRVVDHLLIYTGIHRIKEAVEGDVTSRYRSLNNMTFNYDNDADLTTFGFIYYSPTNIVTKFEWSNLVTRWSNTEKQSDNGWSAAIGFAW